MARGTLILMCGPSGSGKSTEARKMVMNYTAAGRMCGYVSRDNIRFDMVREDKDYFSHEKDVFDLFVLGTQIQLAIYDVVIADATFLNERSRNKFLDRLELANIDIECVYMNVSLDTCIKQNSLRSGRTRVPETIIRQMYESYRIPSHYEKHNYSCITKIGNYEENVNRCTCCGDIIPEGRNVCTDCERR